MPPGRLLPAGGRGNSHPARRHGHRPLHAGRAGLRTGALGHQQRPAPHAGGQSLPGRTAFRLLAAGDQHPRRRRTGAPYPQSAAGHRGRPLSARHHGAGAPLQPRGLPRDHPHLRGGPCPRRRPQHGLLHRRPHPQGSREAPAGSAGKRFRLHRGFHRRKSGTGLPSPDAGDRGGLHGGQALQVRRRFPQYPCSQKPAGHGTAARRGTALPAGGHGPARGAGAQRLRARGPALPARRHAYGPAAPSGPSGAGAVRPALSWLPRPAAAGL